MKVYLEKYKNSKGLTIIELIISIFVLSIAIIGIFSVFSAMTILTSDSADRLTATYLAQEGMEIVRNIRDTNWLYIDNQPEEGANYSWLDGIVNCIGGGCEVDYKTTGYNPNPVLPYIGKYLKIDSSLDEGGFYEYASGNDSKFIRKIIISPVTDINETSDYIIRVKVEVAWNQKASIIYPGVLAGDTLSDDCNTNKNNCIIVEGILYNWYKAKSSNKSITAFGFIGYEDIKPDISEGAIDVELPFETSPEVLTELDAFFVNSIGSSVTVNGIEQLSIEVNPGYLGNVKNFTSPVIYKVTAADGSSQNYTVTVTIATAAIP